MTSTATTGTTTMAVWVAVLTALGLAPIIFIGPKYPPYYSRKQWALLLAAGYVLWIPVGWYIFFVAVPSNEANQKHVAGIGALNMLVCGTLFVLIAKWILKKR